MRATMTVTGPDEVGICAAVTSEPVRPGADVLDVSRTPMDEWCPAVLLRDLSGSGRSVQRVREAVRAVGQREPLSVRLQSEEIVGAVHTV